MLRHACVLLISCGHNLHHYQILAVLETVRMCYINNVKISTLVTPLDAFVSQDFTGLLKVYSRVANVRLYVNNLKPIQALIYLDHSVRASLTSSGAIHHVLENVAQGQTFPILYVEIHLVDLYNAIVFLAFNSQLLHNTQINASENVN